ncbi:MAG: DUF1365 domain-containing protein [Vicinamibacterales bacterium]
MVAGPALYTGQLRHRRFRPTAHAFTYRLFLVLLDIDQIEAAMSVSPWLSVNRFNWATYDDRDYLGDPAQPLRARVHQAAAAHGVDWPDGPTYLLTHLRYLGYCFNPISFYFGCDADGHVRTTLVEVHSTFGEQTVYALPGASPTSGTITHRTAKTMHVSPFNRMDLDYTFAIRPPGAAFTAHMTTVNTEGDAFFDATLTLERQPWTRADIHRALRRHPAMTAKVIGAIHFEALRLWWKGLPYIPHPTRR